MPIGDNWFTVSTSGTGGNLSSSYFESHQILSRCEHQYLFGSCSRPRGHAGRHRWVDREWAPFTDARLEETAILRAITGDYTFNHDVTRSTFNKITLTTNYTLPNGTAYAVNFKDIIGP